MRKGGICVLGDWAFKTSPLSVPVGAAWCRGKLESPHGNLWVYVFPCLCIFMPPLWAFSALLCRFPFLVHLKIMLPHRPICPDLSNTCSKTQSQLLLEISEIYVAVVCGKESVGEILSVNYLFYGPREYHTQQSVQLNRIFHESFLSFWAAWGNVCVSDSQAEQQRPFWYSGP